MKKSKLLRNIYNKLDKKFRYYPVLHPKVSFTNANINVKLYAVDEVGRSVKVILDPKIISYDLLISNLNQVERENEDK